MRVEQYVGQRIRERRDELDMTQEEFGREVGRWLGKPWSRSTVSVAENGKRAFTAAELVAIAHVLSTSPTHLLTPPAGLGEIRMPSGETVDRNRLFALVTASPGEDFNLAAAENTLSVLLERAVRNQEDAAQIVSLARDLGLLITRQVTVGPTPSWTSPEEQARSPLFTDKPPVVAAIVTSPLGVLVGRRKDGKPPWTFIAGEMEPGEQGEDTAVREVKEETGLEVRAGEIIGERYHPKTERVMYYIAATPVRGTDVFVGDEEELAAVKWVSLPELDDLMGASNIFEPVHEYLARKIGEA